MSAGTEEFDYNYECVPPRQTTTNIIDYYKKHGATDEIHFSNLCLSNSELKLFTDFLDAEQLFDHITGIDLSNCKVDHDALDQITNMIEGASASLIDLNLSDIEFEGGDQDDVINMIINNLEKIRPQRLKGLNMTGCKLDDEHVASLSRMLRALAPSLKQAVFMHNYLASDGIVSILRSLSNNDDVVLQRIYLGSNYAGNLIVDALLTEIYLPELQILELGGNQLKEQNVQRLQDHFSDYGVKILYEPPDRCNYDFDQFADVTYEDIYGSREMEELNEVDGWYELQVLANLNLEDEENELVAAAA